MTWGLIITLNHLQLPILILSYLNCDMLIKHIAYPKWFYGNQTRIILSLSSILLSYVFLIVLELVFCSLDFDKVKSTSPFSFFQIKWSTSTFRYVQVTLKLVIKLICQGGLIKQEKVNQEVVKAILMNHGKLIGR